MRFRDTKQGRNCHVYVHIFHSFQGHYSFHCDQQHALPFHVSCLFCNALPNNSVVGSTRIHAYPFKMASRVHALLQVLRSPRTLRSSARLFMPVARSQPLPSPLRHALWPRTKAALRHRLVPEQSPTSGQTSKKGNAIPLPSHMWLRLLPPIACAPSHLCIFAKSYIIHYLNNALRVTT